MTIYEMYCMHIKEGKTLDEVAEKTGLSRYQVHRRIIKYRWYRGEVVISAEKLREDYLHNDCSIEEIADIYCCSRETIRRKLHKYNIPIKPRGNPNLDKKG